MWNNQKLWWSSNSKFYLKWTHFIFQKVTYSYLYNDKDINLD